ncbi:hypothetical protein GF420_15225 [candidate division GN15 bacterium]|nr:hypothetical protein [candidate division GN15 bacterium]
MTHKISWLALIALTMVVVALLLSCNDGEPPVGPEPVEEYVVYFSDAGYPHRYYRYFTAAERVDTVTIPYSSHDGLAVSADGKRLYLTNEDRTAVVDTDSLQFIAEIPHQGRIAASPDNRLVAVLGPDTRILSATDYTTLFHDTITTYYGVFSKDSERLYCVGGLGVVLIDLSKTPPSRTTKAFAHTVRWVEPSPDERHWFLYRLVPGIWSYDMLVHDTQVDSVVFNRLLVPGGGHLRVEPTGQYVFFTNPGTLLQGPPAWPLVFVLDIDMNQVVDSIHTGAIDGGSMLPTLLVVTPDGRKLIAVGGLGQAEFSVIDISRLEEIEHYELGNTVDIWRVACQTGM